MSEYPRMDNKNKLWKLKLLKNVSYYFDEHFISCEFL